MRYLNSKIISLIARRHPKISFSINAITLILNIVGPRIVRDTAMHFGWEITDAKATEIFNQLKQNED